MHVAIYHFHVWSFAMVAAIYSLGVLASAAALIAMPAAPCAWLPSLPEGPLAIIGAIKGIANLRMHRGSTTS